MSEPAPDAAPARPDSAPDRRGAPAMFDRIARRYDLLNRCLSLGLDMRWRRRVAAHLGAGSDLRVLDLATGTGDQLIALFEATDRIGEGVGMDLAGEMLALGRDKMQRSGLDDHVTLQTGDACAIPSPDGAFDAVTISFGIRNVPDVPRALREMRRVLRPGGRACLLEFSLPRNRILRGLHLFYLRHVLPAIGGLVSGDHAAYRYLNRTIESFPYGEAFCALLRDAGFEEVAAHPLTGGIVSIYVGRRPAGEASA